MAREFQVTFDCADPAALSTFWAAALGYKLADPPEGSATWAEWLQKIGVPEEEWDEGSAIAHPEQRGPRIYFQRVHEPKTAKNRLHLDVNASAGPTAPLDQRKEQVDAGVDRLLGLGARRLAAYEERDHYHVLMQDPEGNEFCLR